MPLALEHEQSLKRRLENIQRAIGARLSQALADPETRPDNAEAIATLASEAQAIVNTPKHYQLSEPWQVDDPQEMDLLVALHVNETFANAPTNHFLTECLIEAWNEDLHAAAASGESQRWSQAMDLMRQDATRIIAFVARPSGNHPRGRNRANARTLLRRAATRISQITERLPTAEPAELPPFQRACVRAIAELDETMQWLTEETHTSLDWTKPDPMESETVSAIKELLRNQYALANRQTEEFESFLSITVPNAPKAESPQPS